MYIYNLSNKKCVYIIKKRAYVYIHVCGSCLNKCISVALGPPNKNSWLRPWLLEDFSSRSWPIRRILHVETYTRHCLIHVKRVNQLMPLPISKKKKKMKSLFFIGLIPCHFFFFFCNLCFIYLGNICKWVEVLKP